MIPDQLKEAWPYIILSLIGATITAAGSMVMFAGAIAHHWPSMVSGTVFMVGGVLSAECATRLRDRREARRELAQSRREALRGD